MKLRITIDGKEYDVEVEILEDDRGYGGAPQALPTGQPAAPIQPAVPAAAAVRPAAPAANQPGPKDFPSPIAGAVRAVKIKSGDEVEKNQELFVLEAMKMETSVRSPGPGKVKTVHVQEGQNVQAGQILVDFH